MRQEVFLIDLPFTAGSYECEAAFYAIGGKHLIVLKDRRKNPVGITNAVEYAATAALAMLSDAPSPESIRFVQVTWQGKCAEVRFSRTEGSDRLSNPVWLEISAEKLDSMINQYELCAV